LELDSQIDLWALGCTIYELYTGKVLFNPHKTNSETTDMIQLCEIQSIFGLFPKEYYESRKKYVFFNNTYLLQNGKRINYIGFDNKIKKDLCDCEKYDEQIVKNIKTMLEYD
jgi:serine/threonine protein kinase